MPNTTYAIAHADHYLIYPSKSIISMVTVGSYRHMYVYDILLGDFIGSTLSMAFQCNFSLPVSHSIRQAIRFRTLPISLPFSNPFLFWLCLILFTFSGPFLFRFCFILLAFSVSGSALIFHLRPYTLNYIAYLLLASCVWKRQNSKLLLCQESCQTRVAFFTTQIVFGNKLPIHSSLITKAMVSYPDPHRSCGWITSPLCRTNFCGSGYETTKQRNCSFLSCRLI